MHERREPPRKSVGVLELVQVLSEADQRLLDDVCDVSLVLHVRADDRRRDRLAQSHQTVQ